MPFDVICKYLKLNTTVDGEFSQLYDYDSDSGIPPIFVDWAEGACLWSDYDLRRYTYIHPLARYDDRNRS